MTPAKPASTLRIIQRLLASAPLRRTAPAHRSGAPLVTEAMISATTATGGILIFGLGLLELREVRVANMLPALLFAPLILAAVPLPSL